MDGVRADVQDGQAHELSLPGGRNDPDCWALKETTIGWISRGQDQLTPRTRRGPAVPGATRPARTEDAQRLFRDGDPGMAAEHEVGSSAGVKVPTQDQRFPMPCGPGTGHGLGMG